MLFALWQVIIGIPLKKKKKRGTPTYAPIDDNRADVVSFGLRLFYFTNVQVFCAGLVDGVNPAVQRIPSKGN